MRSFGISMTIAFGAWLNAPIVFAADAEIRTEKSQAIFSNDPAECATIPGAPDPTARHALPGACVEYILTAENIGDAAATQLSLTDALNANLFFVAATHAGFAAGGSNFGLSTPASFHDCAQGGCSVVLQDAALDPGELGQIIIRAIIK